MAQKKLPILGCPLQRFVMLSFYLLDFGSGLLSKYVAIVTNKAASPDSNQKLFSRKYMTNQLTISIDTASTLLFLDIALSRSQSISNLPRWG